MNVLKIKGSHNAIKSGIEAGKTIYEKLVFPENHGIENPRKVEQYEKNIKKSWIWKEMHESRNFKNSFKNLYTGLFYGGVFKFLSGR
jgi:electron-transferring-flavoprotein dehydrogenase